MKEWLREHLLVGVGVVGGVVVGVVGRVVDRVPQSVSEPQLGNALAQERSGKQSASLRRPFPHRVVLAGKRCRREQHGVCCAGFHQGGRASRWFVLPAAWRLPGAADDWREAMQQEARSVLENWNADLAVVGVVKQSGEALSLWFVPRSGEGTLSRG